MYNKILIPIAFDFEGDGAAAIAAAKALRGEGGVVRLLHVLESVPNYVTAEIPESALHEVRERAEQNLAAASKLIGGEVETDVVFGRPSQTIIDYSKENAVDCIVMRSHQPAFEDYLIGSTAAHVARHATCAVHILK